MDWDKIEERRRAVIAKAPCPDCNAPLGHRCLSTRGNLRRALHQRRHAVADGADFDEMRQRFLVDRAKRDASREASRRG